MLVGKFAGLLCSLENIKNAATLACWCIQGKQQEHVRARLVLESNSTISPAVLRPLFGPQGVGSVK